MAKEYHQFKDESGDKKYFAMVPYILTNGYNATEIGIYTYIKRKCGESDDGTFYEVKTKTAKKLGISFPTLKKSLELLEKDGRIKCVGTQVFKTSPVKLYKIVDIWKENIEVYHKRELKNTKPSLPSLKRELKNKQSRELKNKQSKKKPVKKNSVIYDNTAEPLKRKLKDDLEEERRGLIKVYADFKNQKPNFPRNARIAGEIVREFPSKEVNWALNYFAQNVPPDKWSLESVARKLEQEQEQDKAFKQQYPKQ